MDMERINRFKVMSKDVLQTLSIGHAKFVAFLIVVGLCYHHWTIRTEIGTDTCDWLMTQGRFRGDHIWQPTGCMLHNYTAREVRQCLRNTGRVNRLTFMGDSRVRYQYHTLRVFLTGEDLEPRWRKNRRSNMYYGDPDLNLQLNFIWNEQVNETLFRVYRRWANNDSANQLTDSNDAPPTVLVTGGISWPIKHMHEEGNDKPLRPYIKNVTKLLPYIQKLNRRTTIYWMAQEDVVEYPFRFTTNHLVSLFNKAVDIIFKNTANVKIWKSSREISLGYKEWTFDGLHLIPEILDQDMQVFLNMYCNNHVQTKDGTCCKDPEPISGTQAAMATTFVVSFAVFFLSFLYKYRSKHRTFNIRNDTKQLDDCNDESEAISKQTTGIETQSKCWKDGAYEISKYWTRLGVIMLYFIICDRANWFMKENKVYSHQEFYNALIVLFVLGVVISGKSKQSTILNRDQTDEWKGWMQLVILTYHITGASQVLGIYMNIRVLVSMYLFLSGYGHFFFYFTKADFSLRRFGMVLFRCNFLVVTLCPTMNRPYQFYYFVPLVSFWFVVIYVVMAIPPRVTKDSLTGNKSHYALFLFKLVALLLLITLFYHSKMLFEYVFTISPVKYLVTIDGSVHEWYFRWSIDRYSAVSGLVFAVLLHAGKQYLVVDDTDERSLFGQYPHASKLLQLAAFAGIYGYMLFAETCHSKEECNLVHAYISFIPIVSFVMLRNSVGWLRVRHSYFFAWFGKISLELFIAQYHIWLAADTHGVLVLVPGYPVLNVILTSFIFVCVAHEIHDITSSLLPFFIRAKH